MNPHQSSPVIGSGILWLVTGFVAMTVSLMLAKASLADFSTETVIVFQAIPSVIASLIVMSSRRSVRSKRSPEVQRLSTSGSRKTWAWLFARSLAATAATFFMIYGIARLDIIEASALLALEPAFLAMVSMIFFGRSLTRQTVIQMPICLIATGLVVLPPLFGAGGSGTAQLIIGTSAILCCLVCLALQNCITGKIGPAVSAPAVIFWSNLMKAAVFLPFIFTDDLRSLRDPELFGVIVGSGVLWWLAVTSIAQAFRTNCAAAMAPLVNSRVAIAVLLTLGVYGVMPHEVSTVGVTILVGLVLLNLVPIVCRSGHMEISYKTA